MVSAPGDGVVGGVGDGAVDVRGGLDGGSAGRIGVGRGVAVVAAAMGSRVDGVRGGARAGGVPSPTSAVLASVAAVARERADATSERSEQREDGRRDLRARSALTRRERLPTSAKASRVAARFARVKLVEGENVRGIGVRRRAARRVEGGAVGLDAGRGAVRVRVHVRKASEGRYQGYRAVVLDAMAARPRDATN